ncbi:DNA polymerase III subunit delta' [Methylomarinum vadi]|uniref:DNA polymerase III subunit delta' n=1 Tax=Methylomarinum vadi TaxID=438855 RepID=UPI000AB3EE8F|nr:DNA polymerase III subunit delta' [Methylomarinum vadi]
MKQDSLYPWLQDNWRHLTAYIAQQRIPQALLIQAGPGLGMLHLAESYAQALLCERPTEEYFACGGCHGCRLFAAGTHPDYLFIEPEESGKAIGIDSIRQLINKLALKPQYPMHRCIVINSADSLNNAAANAFLKCLEEPTERTSIVLLAENPAKLPATIRSRCQLMTIAPPDTVVTLDWLKQYRIDADADLLRMAQGAPLRAKDYAERNLLAVHETYLNDWLKLARGQGNAVQLAERWQKQEAVSLSEVLSWMAQWLVIIVKCAYRADCDIGQHSALQELSKRLDLLQVYRFYDVLLSSIQKLDTQLNKQLMIEYILIEWSRLNKR